LISSGVDFIDTAEVSGYGKSEEVLPIQGRNAAEYPGVVVGEVHEGDPDEPSDGDQIPSPAADIHEWFRPDSLESQSKAAATGQCGLVYDPLT